MSYRKKHIKPKLKSLRRRKKFFQTKSFWIIFALLIILGTAGYFLFFFPEFQISKVTVSGNQTIASQTIENIAWTDIDSGLFNKSVFFINTGSLAKNISRAFLNIANVNVQKNLLGSISINVTERAPYGAFCQTPTSGSDQCFTIDQTGIIFQTLPSEPAGEIIVRQNASSQTFSLGQQAVAGNIMAMIGDIQTNLKNNFQINVTEALAGNPLVITTSEGWQVYFDPTSDIDTQIVQMDALLSTQITADQRKTLQYIYLQYKDKAYYK